MKNILSGALLLGISLTANAGEIPSFLRNMDGCFSVTYSFVEDGSGDEFFEPVLEKSVLEDGGDVIHLRRTLILGADTQNHWREEWRVLDANTQVWEQTVYGPFEDFRYRCSGNLIENSWRCEAPDSPKPRRDKDKPYAKLDRENTLKVNGTRWIHAQKNTKKVDDGTVYAVELGWNRYERQAPSACDAQTPSP